VQQEEHLLNQYSVNVKKNVPGQVGTLSMSDTRGSCVGGVDRVGDVDPVSCSGGRGDRVNRGSTTAKASKQ